jgi:transposase
MNNQQDNIEAFAAYIGLDYADQKHAFCLQETDSNNKEFDTLEQKPEALIEWANSLRARFDGRPVAIILEQSKGALINALMSYDFLVLYPINPKALAKYREALRLSGAKDDPSDAELLLTFLRAHPERLRPWRPDDVATRQLSLLTVHRRAAVDERTRLTNQLTAQLKGYFPQALLWIGDLTSAQAHDFLLKWPTLQALQKTTPARLRQFYIKHGSRRLEVIEERIEQIQTAVALTNDPAIVQTSILMVQGLVQVIAAWTKSIARLDEQIKELFTRHPDYHIFKSFPGAGAALAPRLSAAMGSDRQRYQDAQQVQQFSGIAPVTSRSGKSIWIHRRWACPKFLKQSFHEFAEQSLRFSDWARAYYDQQRAKGAAYHVAVRALAYKWIRIIYACWKNRTPYDELRYLEALKRRGSPLAAKLAA